MHKLNISIDSMNVKDEDIKYLTKMLENSEVTIFNNNLLTEFENLFSNFLSNNIKVKSVTLPSCTSAIYIALQLLNLDEDDEIIIPNITHASAILAIIHHRKYKIKVCDFKENSYDLDINHLQTLITSKTKGIIISYLHGFTFNVNEIKNICEAHNIKIIEDAAQGLGVRIGKNLAGTIGDYGCFSFGANKLLKMGEGGALCYKNHNDLNSINKYRHVGEVWKSSGLSTVSNNSTYGDILTNGFDYIDEGFNFRCNPLQVALSMRTLKELDNIIANRQEKLKIYHTLLKDIKGIHLINNNIEDSAPISAWFIIDPNYFDINKIIIKCLEYGIPVGKFKYSTVSNIGLFKKYIINTKDSFTNSLYINTNSLFMPLYENISISDIKDIADRLKVILEQYDFLEYDETILEKPIEYFNGFFLK